MHTEIGKIGKALQTLVPELSSIQRETRRAVLIFAVVGLALCVLVRCCTAYTRGDWLNGLLAGITLAMANLPEEFPVVLTVFLALGAWRISQQRRADPAAPAIETLGSTTVLCVDKTGTLTQNRMAVRRLWVPGKSSICKDPDGAFLPDLLEFSVLASEREPFDPMEKAYHQLAQERAPATSRSSARGHSLTRTRCLPNSCRSPMSGSRRAATATWWRPRVRRRRSWNCARSTAPNARQIHAQVATMAGDGLRVLAVASGTLSPAHGEQYRVAGDRSASCDCSSSDSPGSPTPFGRPCRRRCGNATPRGYAR